jgi:hypothetical protein
LRACCATQSFASFVVSALQRYGLHVATLCALHAVHFPVHVAVLCCALCAAALHVACCLVQVCLWLVVACLPHCYLWFLQVWMAASLLSGISCVAFCMLPFGACGSACRESLMPLRASTRSTHPAHSPHQAARPHHDARLGLCCVAAAMPSKLDSHALRLRLRLAWQCKYPVLTSARSHGADEDPNRRTGQV